MGSQKPGFCENTSFQPTDLVKNPVSLVGVRKSCSRMKSSAGKYFPTL
jgi:hypothetical protein